MISLFTDITPRGDPFTETIEYDVRHQILSPDGENVITIEGRFVPSTVNKRRSTSTELDMAEAAAEIRERLNELEQN